MYHDLIFESAECVFGAKGFEHTTMQDVAREAGISLKTLYATYPGKRELYDEIQQVRGRAFVETVLAASVGDADTALRLEGAVRAYVEFLSDHRDWLRIHLQTRTSWGLRPLAEFAADYWQRGLDHFAGIVRAGMKERVFYEGDAGEAAALVLAIMQVRVAQIAEEPETDRDAAVRDIMLHLQRLLCR
jgi:AcrR family transcriptional regulator